jgi:DNA-binding transcriptional regulator YhcF (GntR family)
VAAPVAGDSFTKDKFAWLDQVAGDPRVPGASFKGAYVLATKYVNRASGDAWPSQKTLAAAIGVSERTVRNIFGPLVTRGHLAVVIGKGPGQSNHYRPILEKRKKAAAIDEDENRQKASGIEPPKEEESFLFSDANTGKPAHQYRQNHVANTGKPLPPNPLNEPFEEPFERSIPRKAHSIADDFDAFYDAYPRKKARQAAFRAFKRIVKKNEATAAELIAGAERYAATREREDPNFTPYPATWLNAGSWQDEDEQPARHTSGAASAIAGVFAGYRGNADG